MAPRTGTTKAIIQMATCNVVIGVAIVETYRVKQGVRIGESKDLSQARFPLLSDSYLHMFVHHQYGHYVVKIELSLHLSQGRYSPISRSSCPVGLPPDYLAEITSLGYITIG